MYHENGSSLPWINNCVGHHNHKSFTLFLFFVVVGCFHGALMMTLCVIDHLLWVDGSIVLKIDKNSPIIMNHYLLLCLFFGTGLSIGVALAVAILLYYQMKSISRNETGIESWIVEKARSRARYDGDVFVYPYDLGLFENIQQVLTWSHDYVGDGITWPVFDGCDQYTLTIEQLEQKDIKRENTVIYRVVKSFNGAWFPISFGVRVCFDSPWSEESRVPVQQGDVIHATRVRKRWVYGEKITKRNASSDDQIALGEPHRLKGWIPRCCVERQSVENGRPKTKEKVS